MVLSDNDLVKQAATGDDHAFARLLEEHGGCGHIWGRGGNNRATLDCAGAQLVAC